MTATIRTLAELNANPYRFTWNQYTVECTYSVGRTGSSRRGTSGAKLHLVRTETVVAMEGDAKPGHLKVGSVFSIVGSCNQNGQHNGTTVKGKDTDAITCEKCLGRVQVQG